MIHLIHFFKQRYQVTIDSIPIIGGEVDIVC